MGGAFSKTDQYALFHKRGDVVDWSQYVESPWRASRSQELDKFGGVSRVAIPRGSSMTAKLGFLQEQVGAQASEIQHEFKKTINEFKAESQAQEQDSFNVMPLVRSALEGPSVTGSLGSFIGVPRPNLSGSGNSMTSLRSFRAKPPTATQGVKRVFDRAADLDRIRAKNKALRVAGWRINMHEARRRVMTIVMVANRFQAGSKHPKRLRRVDSFSYYIPAVLQDDIKRFVSTAKKYEECVERVAQQKAEEEAAKQRALDEAAARAAAELLAAEGSVVSINRSASGHKKAYRPLMGLAGGANLMRKLTATSAATTPTPAANAPPKKPAGGGAFGPGGGAYSAAGAAAADARERAKAEKMAEERAAKRKAAALTGPPSLDVQPSSKSEGSMLLKRGALESDQNGAIGPLSPQGPPMPPGPLALPTPTTISNTAASRRATLERLPEQQYQGATAALASSLSLLPEPVPRLLEPLPVMNGSPLRDPMANGHMSPSASQVPTFQLGAQSKFGYTSAAGKSLMPRRVKGLVVERQQFRRSESGMGSASQVADIVEAHHMDQVAEDDESRFDFAVALMSAAVGAPVQRGTQSCSGVDLQLNQLQPPAPPAGLEFVTTPHLTPPPLAPTPELLQPEPPSQPNALSGQMAGRPTRRAGSHPRIANGTDPEHDQQSQPENEHDQQGQPENGHDQPEQEAADVSHETAHDFKHHLDNLRQQNGNRKGVRLSIEEEVAAESAAMAKDIVEAREQMRQDEVAAAQRQLEAEWEAELHAPSQNLPEEATVESSGKLLSMYVNRGNAAWASSRQWGAPTLWDRAKQEEWMAHEDWNAWKARTAYCLKAGGFAVQIHATGPGVHFPQTGRTFDVWSSDPWELIHHHRAGLSVKERVVGVSLGIRILANLVSAVEALGGKEGVSRLSVILHLSEEQFETQLPVMRLLNFSGLDPKNLIIFVQRKRPGYIFDDKLTRFVPRTSGHVDGCGTGHSLMQLNWVGEAWVLDKEGRPHRMLGTALEELQARGVEWLVSQSANDLGLLTRESCMDLVLLPFLMSAHKAAGVTAITQVVREDGLGWAARTNGSVILAPTNLSGRASTVRSTLSNLPGSHPAVNLGLVMELRALELHSGSMKEVVRAGKHAGSHYLLGLDRHVVHLHELAVSLTSPDIVRPKLLLNEGGLHIKLDFDVEEMLPLIRAQDSSAHFRKLMGNRRMTSHLDASPRPNALSSAQGNLRPSNGQVVFGNDGKLQGSGPSSGPFGFGLVPQSSGSNPPSPIRGNGSHVGTNGQGGHNLVVFISSNNVSHIAVEAALAIAKPGRDIIHLVTVVTGYMYVEGGQALLDGHYNNVARALVEARQEVLVLDKEDPQLVDTMEHYVEASQAEMVVMATKALNNTQLQGSTILGSVTLAALKRLRVPVMVVNGNSLNVQEALRHHMVRGMALVHRHAGPLVHYMTDRILQPARGDTMVLCRVEDPSMMGGVVKVNAAGSNGHNQQKTAGLKLNHQEQHVLMLQRQLASMNQAATMAGLPQPLTVSLEEDRVDEIVKVINKEGVHLLGYLLPSVVGKVPEQLVHLIHSCRCAVLCFKHHGNSNGKPPVVPRD